MTSCCWGKDKKMRKTWGKNIWNNPKKVRSSSWVQTFALQLGHIFWVSLSMTCVWTWPSLTSLFSAFWVGKSELIIITNKLVTQPKAAEHVPKLKICVSSLLFEFIQMSAVSLFGSLICFRAEIIKLSKENDNRLSM